MAIQTGTLLLTHDDQTGTLLLTHDDCQILAARPMQFPISMTSYRLWCMNKYDVILAVILTIVQEQGKYQVYHNLLSSALASITFWKEKVVTYLVFIFQ